MNRKKLTPLGKGLIVLIIGSTAFLVWKYHPFFQNSGTPDTEPETTSLASASPSIDTGLLDEYRAGQQVNPEYVGRLLFDSGLIDQNVVQATDNEKYLNLTWDLKVSTSGAAFLDYRNQLSDQNLIIYGHYVYYDADKMFTPLEKLIDEDNYEANKYFCLHLSNGESRKYLITDVFYYVMGNEDLEYYRVEYDSDYFNQYYKAVKEADLYNTGESLTLNDHWVSLQTCVRNHDELRELILAKEVE